MGHEPDDVNRDAEDEENNGIKDTAIAAKEIQIGTQQDLAHTASSNVEAVSNSRLHRESTVDYIKSQRDEYAKKQEYQAVSHSTRLDQQAQIEEQEVVLPPPIIRGGSDNTIA